MMTAAFDGSLPSTPQLAQAAATLTRCATLAAGPAGGSVAAELRRLRPHELRRLCAVLWRLLPLVDEAMREASARTVQRRVRRHARERTRGVGATLCAALRLQRVARGRLVRGAMPCVRMRRAVSFNPLPPLPRLDTRTGATHAAESCAFRVAFTPTRGRALVAARAIAAGESILRELPTAQVVGHAAGAAAECHEMLAQLICAGGTAIYHRPVGELLSLVEQHRAADPQLLDEVASHAVGAVRELVRQRAGARAAAIVDAEAVTCAFCKHLLNSMTIVDAESLQPLGMGLYAQYAALLNHDNMPNCWVLFEPTTDAAGHVRYAAVLRSLCAIGEGVELTIAYIDVARPKAEVSTCLAKQYFIPPDASGGDAMTALITLLHIHSYVFRAKQGVDALKQLEELSRQRGRSFLAAHALHPDDTGRGQATHAQDETTPLLAGTYKEPAALVPTVCRDLDACTQADDWEGALLACQQLLYLYRYCYRVVHPQVGLRHLTAGLAALKQPNKDLATSQSMLQKAVKVLSITHGDAHVVTRGAAETLSLVNQLLLRSAERQALSGHPPLKR